MPHAQLIDNLNHSLRGPQDALAQLPHVLLGQGFIVADAFVRTVHGAAHFGGAADRMALGPARDDLGGTLQFDLDRAREVAMQFRAGGQPVQVVSVRDWHSRRATDLEALIVAIRADRRVLLGVDLPTFEVQL